VADFTRGFRLHLGHGRVLDGAARARAVLDVHPE
jgi:hypothetical protein